MLKKENLKEIKLLEIRVKRIYFYIHGQNQHKRQIIEYYNA
jgi:hypothetical protein